MGSDREQKLIAWLSENGYEKASIVDLSGDASFRKYYRVKKKNLSYVVMNCPPAVSYTHLTLPTSPKV